MLISETAHEPGLTEALIPIAFLIVALATSVYLFGEDSSSGANQIALFAASGVALFFAWQRGSSWRELEKAISDGVATTVNALLIMLVVGALIGSWILAGTVPAMIYYGLKLIEPNAFYVTTTIVCALAAVSTGSSWSTIGTVGVALIGMANALGLSLEVTAGAIVSGAYFGDKMSPLSDTTNLAPAIVGVDLFEHIKHMTWTTVPAITIAVMIFAVLGANAGGDVDVQSLNSKFRILEDMFHIGPHLLLPALLPVVLAFRKVPALPAMMISAFTGTIFGLLFQRAIMVEFTGIDGLRGVVTASWTVLFGGFEAQTGDGVLDALLSRGGMSGMLNTVWLVIAAMTFGAIIERLGYLRCVVNVVLSSAKTASQLVFTAILTCIGVNIVAADQYISIVLPGRAYRAEFNRRKLAPQNLSRILEDAGTVTSPLIPWNTCGAFIFGALGVSAFAYAPYCFFNLLSPAISALYGITRFKVLTLDETHAP